LTAGSDITQLPPLREIIRAYDLRAEKKLGQNFLLDLNLTQKIAKAAGNVEHTHLIEIGPGPGGLTRALLNTPAPHVTAIEYDPRAIEALQSLKEASHGRLTLVAGDALSVDLMCLSDAPRAVVANLPYNIATPLLIGWLKQIREHQAFQHLTLMFQKEVAQRIVASQGSEFYGRLSVMSQWLCTPKIAFDISASAFTPPPKVTSSVVHFIPKTRPPTSPSFSAMEQVTALAFGQRRKMIRSSLKIYADAVKACGLDDTKRAEELSVEDFSALAQAIS
jgi:16S rRNA (adenine1518-N6/adenine1519-N6)-dimethyltransferase